MHQHDTQWGQECTSLSLVTLWLWGKCRLFVSVSVCLCLRLSLSPSLSLSLVFNMDYNHLLNSPAPDFPSSTVCLGWGTPSGLPTSAITQTPGGAFWPVLFFHCLQWCLLTAITPRGQTRDSPWPCAVLWSQQAGSTVPGPQGRASALVSIPQWHCCDSGTYSTEGPPNPTWSMQIQSSCQWFQRVSPCRRALNFFPPAPHLFLAMVGWVELGRCSEQANNLMPN